MGKGHEHSHEHEHEHEHHDHHDHDHAHAQGHGHDHARGASESALLAALWITAGFMVAEAIGGWLAASLALVADAAHLLADAGALAMGYAAARAARRPATEIMSYGHHRWQVLAAFVNGLVLLLLSAWIVIEAARRLFTPSDVNARVMLVIGVLGVLANLASYAVLSRGTHSLNVRGALLHVLSDILGNVGAVIAGAVILLTRWTPIDPLLSIVMALLVVRSGFRITREAAHILLEGSPETFDLDAVEGVIKSAVPSVAAVHHVHAWSLTDEKPMLTLHVVMCEGGDHTQCLQGVHRALREGLNISHATVQIETIDCGDGADCSRVQLHAEGVS